MADRPKKVSASDWRDYQLFVRALLRLLSEDEIVQIFELATDYGGEDNPLLRPFLR